MQIIRKCKCEILPHTFWDVYYKKDNNIKCLQGCGEKKKKTVVTVLQVRHNRRRYFV